MKKSVFLRTLTALALSFGLVLGGCGEPGDSSGSGPVGAVIPVITVEPLDAKYGTGDSAEPLRVTASVSDGGILSYQWYSNATADTTNGTLISVATSASYTPDITQTGTVYYYVVVTNTNNAAAGEKTAVRTSRAAKVEKVAGILTHAQTPSISGQPAGGSYTAGAQATALSVTATVGDGGTLSYQWYKNTENSTTEGGTLIGGATSASYAPPVTSVGTVYYYVIVTNTNNVVNGTTVKTAVSNTAAIIVTAPGSGGLTWTNVVDSDVDDKYFSAIAYGGGKFVAGGGSGKRAYSEDGVNWTAVGDSAFGNSDVIYSIAYGNSKFVAGGYSYVGGNMAHSTDGTSWTTVGTSPFGTNESINGIAYGGGKFVAGGSFGKMAYSTDGETWTPVTDTTFSSNEIHSIAYGNGKFVAVGGVIGVIGVSGVAKIAYSTDGETWTAVGSNPFSQAIYSITYGGGKFVAGGCGGEIAYSTGGETWTAVETSAFNGNDELIRGIAYGSGWFVAVSELGEMAYSNNQ